ncbi:5-aminolevulinate synthase, erythroid-specific, mitochondrial-like [Eudromia elegans]
MAAALLRCPVLARDPRMLRILIRGFAAPPRTHPEDPPSPCPFMERGGAGGLVHRAPPELQEDVGTRGTAHPDPDDPDDPEALLLSLLEPEQEPEPERSLQDNLPEDAFPYEAVLGARLAALRRSHCYRVFTALSRAARAPPLAAAPPRGAPVQVWCSNDYLGLSRHPEVLRAARAALSAHGLGAGGTRNIAGTSPLHGALEAALARLHRQPRALLFGSGFAANATALATLARALPGCEIFSDAGNHASMIQGIRAGGVPKHIFRHNDPAHLAELLARSPPGRPRIVAFESLHSMDGSVAPLGELCALAHAHGALTYVDEVHAVGLYGARGGGIAERDGLQGCVDIVAGTLGKALGAVGGYIAGPAPLVDAVRSLGAGFIFTTSLPPAVAAGALAALRVAAGPEGAALRRAQQRHAKHLRGLLRERGLPAPPCASHLVPLPVGDAERATRLSRALLQTHGLYVQAITPPTVPRGGELLRLAPSPHHTAPMMENLLLSAPERRLLERLGPQFLTAAA